MKHSIFVVLGLSCVIALTGCNTAFRSAYPERHLAKNQVKTAVSARTIYLRASAEGLGLTSHSISETNRLLNAQGPIRRQVLTVVPLSPNGQKVAPRLVQALTDAGAREPRVLPYKAPNQTQYADPSTGYDLQLVSEAVVVKVGDCNILNARRWVTKPFYETGPFGCANEANIALMTSDPRDLMRPQPLDDADGSVTALAVQKYQQGETEDLIDIDFSQEDN